MCKFVGGGNRLFNLFKKGNLKKSFGNPDLKQQFKKALKELKVMDLKHKNWLAIFYTSVQWSSSLTKSMH